MNTLDHVVTKILRKPYQVINREECCWKMVVEIDCYGFTSVKTFEATSRSGLDRIKVGYSYQA